MTLWILLQTFCQWVHLYYHNPLPCCITSPVICQILKFYLLHHFSDFVTQVVENNLYSDLWINISQTNYRGQSSWMLKHELCDFSSYKHFNILVRQRTFRILDDQSTKLHGEPGLNKSSVLILWFCWKDVHCPILIIDFHYIESNENYSV